MAKSRSKTNDENNELANAPKVDLPRLGLEPLPLPVPMPPLAIERDWLFDLYLARVAKAETVNTMRRDARAIFRDAFFEAKVALDVYLEMTK